MKIYSFILFLSLLSPLIVILFFRMKIVFSMSSAKISYFYIKIMNAMQR